MVLILAMQALGAGLWAGGPTSSTTADVDASHPRDGETYEETRGDDKHLSDSGHHWLLPAGLQIAFLLVLLGSYLAVRTRGARKLPFRLWARWRSVLVVLLVAVPAAPIAGGSVVSIHPSSGTTAAVADPSPVPLEAGPVGTTTISDGNNSATVETPAPKLWKELELWNCNPVADSCNHEPTAGSFTTYEASKARVDASNFQPEPLFFLEAYMEAPTGETVSLRLRDLTDATNVTGTTVSTSSDSLELVRSGGFRLSGAKDYAFQSRVTGSSSGGAVKSVKLLAMQQFPTAATTQARIASADEVTDTTFTVPESAALWQYDKASMDGIQSVHFEVVANMTSGLVNGANIRLVEVSSGTEIASFSVAASTTTPTRFRSGDIASSLSDGREYQVEAETGSITAKVYLHAARIVIIQSDFSETVQYTSLSWEDSTGSTGWTSAGYAGRYHMDTQWDNRTVFFEGTLADDTLATNASLRLFDRLAGSPVAGSTLNVIGLARTRVRTDVTLNPRNATYRAEFKTEGGLTNALLDNAWIVTHLKVSSLTTMDAGHEANHGTLQNAPPNDPAKHGRGYHLDGTSQQIRIPPGPGLSPSDELTAMLWYRADTTTGTERILSRHSSNPSGFYIQSDGTANTLDAVATVGGSEVSVSDALPPSDAWHHVALTYDGSAVELYVNGSQVASTAASGSLTYPSTGTFIGLGAGGFETLPSTLPSGRWGASVAKNGDLVYLFGGETSSGLTDEILEFNTTSHAVTQVGTLPTAREDTSAVWSGNHAYVFGGEDADGRLDEIVRFDPSTGGTTVMTATLPASRRGTAAVWNGTHAFVFGGKQGGSHDDGPFSDDVVRYDPDSDNATVMDGSLPEGQRRASAFWTGSHAYVLGGSGQGGKIRTIVRYEPSADTISKMDATLPEGRDWGAVAWSGSDAYLFGGDAASGVTDEVLRYNPSTDTLSTTAVPLPSARYGAAAAWNTSTAYVLGGYTGDTYLDGVLEFSPSADRFQGTVDEVRLYGRALSSSEITSLMTNPYNASDGSSSSDPADGPRLLGGEGVALQMDVDDHLQPRNGKTYDYAVRIVNEASPCTWESHLSHVSGSNLDRLDRASISLRGGSLNTQIAVRGGVLRTTSGNPAAVSSGSAIEGVVKTTPTSDGTSTIDATLYGKCQEAGITTERALTFEFT